MKTIEIRPQAGPQTDWLASPAEISIFGGAAGSGKSYGLLLDPLRHIHNPKFGGIIFRRTSVQVRNEGGLWDTSVTLYPLLNGKPREGRLRWQFPSGATIGFAHMEYEKDVLGWQGSQLDFAGFDELTHFSQSQFFYMLSRLRSVSGVKPRLRATTNPDADSWVRKFIDWWIGDDGFPIKERSGKLRWFIRMNDEMVWGDSREEILSKYGPDIPPKSVTFISAKLSDNQILMKKDPSYRSNLLALNRVDRMRLLDGNWNIRAQAGSFFRREWFPVIEAIPVGWVQAIRFWDRAATQTTGTNDPDWTRGVKLLKYPDNTFIVADLKSTRNTPGQVENLIRTVASHDTYQTRIMCQQDPGSAGVAEAEYFIRMLSGYDVRTEVFSKDKITRAKPVSAQAEAGNIRVLRAPWNEEFFRELEGFPDASHDDITDALSGSFNALSHGLSICDAFAINYRR